MTHKQHADKRFASLFCYRTLGEKYMKNNHISFPRFKNGVSGFNFSDTDFLRAKMREKNKHLFHVFLMVQF